jgi:large subunit ribosomal protein L23
MFLKKIFQKKEKEEIKKEEKVEKVKEQESLSPRVKTQKAKKIYAGILKSPHITEKAANLAEQNKYVFQVFPKTTKEEVRKAVEELYGVEVTKVRVINIPRKPKKMGRKIGYQQGVRKAIVEIKKGQKIEILPR